MKFKMKEYESLRPKVLEIYYNTPDKFIEICITSSIPLIAAYTFINDEVGGFDDSVNDLLKFYNYKGVE